MSASSFAFPLCIKTPSPQESIPCRKGDFSLSNLQFKFLQLPLRIYQLNLRSQRLQLQMEVFISALYKPDIIHHRNSFCRQPRDHKRRAGRRSGAVILAPVYFFTPSMMAVFPSTLMLAPILVSSSTYLKRFSNMLSVTMLVPIDNPKVTAICGCISVGKPG